MFFRNKCGRLYLHRVRPLARVIGGVHGILDNEHWREDRWRGRSFTGVVNSNDWESCLSSSKRFNTSA